MLMLPMRMWWSAPSAFGPAKFTWMTTTTRLPTGLMVSLQPRRSTASPSQAAVSDNGEFSVPFVPDEIYDLYVLNGPDNSYLKSVRIANSERLAQGLEASSGDAPPALDVRLSSQGGQVVGRAVTADPKVVASGATVALIPDPAAGRVQAYQTDAGRRVRQLPPEGRGARNVRRGGVAGFPALRSL